MKTVVARDLVNGRGPLQSSGRDSVFKYPPSGEMPEMNDIMIIRPAKRTESVQDDQKNLVCIE